MKKRMYVLANFAHLVFVALPVFLIVITMVHVGFFFYDMYHLFKKFLTWVKS